MIMGCCEWFTRNNQNVDFLYSKMNNIEEKKPSELSSDPDLPEWLNEDYMIENKKEAIKLTLEKRKEELKQRRIHFEKIKKGKFVIQNQIGQMKSIHQKNKNDDDLLDYDSEKDCSDNIDELFKNFRQEKYNNDKKKNLNQENDDSLKIIPFKVNSNILKS